MEAPYIHFEVGTENIIYDIYNILGLPHEPHVGPYARRE
jgi:hypothetical protein